MSDPKNPAFGLETPKPKQPLNESFIDLLGYSEEYLLKVPFLDLVHPDDRESTIQEYQAILNGAKAIDFINRYRKADGSYCSLSWYTAAQPDKGYMICAVKDVTDRQEMIQRLKRSENFLLQAQRAAKLGHWSVDLTTEELVWSEEACRIHELPLSARPRLSDGIEFYDEESRPIITRVFQECVGKGIPYDLELGFITAKNNWRWVRAIGQPAYDGTEITGAFGVFQDMTDQYEARQKMEALNIQLREQVKSLEWANNELSQFVYIASHDLREPLRSIMGFIQILKDEEPELSEDGHFHLERINESARRLNLLVVDLLQYARVGQSPFMEAVNLNDLISEIMDEEAPLIEQVSGEFVVSELPTIEIGKPDADILFRNLISNSLKFCKEGSSPRVEISTNRNPGTGNWEYCVKDNGMGIDPQHRERVFRIFQRLNRRDHYAGTGIGLAICKKVVEVYKGNIWLESTLGSGSSFYFTLPAAATKHEKDNA